MKKENAFTLIELLAVIVILGITAVIATPLAINVIEDAKKNSFKNTAYGLIDAVKLQYAENYLNGNTSELFYTFPDTTGLSFSGESPDGGTIRLTSDGKISLAIYNNKWCAVKGLDVSDVSLRAYEEGKCILQEEADVPVITLNGKDIIYIDIGKTYVEPGYTVKTVGGEELSNDVVNVSVLGQLTGASEINTSIEEIYKVTYTATYKDKTSTATRMVHAGNYKPSIKIEPNKTDGYQQKTDITISVNAFEEYTIDGFNYVMTKDGVEGNVITVNNKTETISLTEDGTYQIKVTATDSEGNTSEATSGTYYIDQTKPTINLTVSGNSFNANNWSKTDVVLDVVTNDIGGSSILNYKYCYGNDCTPSTVGNGNTITISDEGTNNYVCAISIDGAQNESEKVCVGPYAIDKTISEPNIVETASPNSNGWYKSNIGINFTTSSDTSEISEIKYCKTENTTCTPNTTITGSSGSAVIDKESATNYVCALSIDKAGNESAVKCVGPYRLDKTSPSLTVPADATIKVNEVASYDLKAGVSVTDNNTITLDNVSISGSLSAVIAQYTITYTVTDVAGNTNSEIRKITVKNNSVSFTEQMQSSSQVAAEDPDRNLRYVGANPNNYVLFNKELWRIIGVFDGQTKIIKKDNYKAPIAWDTSASSNWETSSLQKELNGTYLSSIKTNDPTSYGYIDLEHIWNLGRLSVSTVRPYAYAEERGTIVYKKNPVTWTGAIGLMYPSDFGYSTGVAGATCDTQNDGGKLGMSQWNISLGAPTTLCYEEAWLYDKIYNQWTITHYDSDLVWLVYKIGVISDANKYDTSYSTNRSARPVLYLKTNVKIVDGLGTEQQPYILGTE